MLNYGSGREYNVRHSEVTVFRMRKNGTKGALKRISPIFPTSGRENKALGHK